MLIHIRKKVLTDAAQLQEPNDWLAMAMQNIAQAKVQGAHLIFIERGAVELIATNLISNWTLRVLTSIESEAAQYGNLREKLAVYVEIEKLDGLIEKEVRNGKTIIKIPLRNFADSRITQRARLVGENINDCRLYERLSAIHIGKYHSKDYPANIKFELIGGGGNTTAESLKELSTENHTLALCITDSDKAMPSSTEGETSKLCSAVRLSYLCHYYNINARSIENLLHYQQIEHILGIEKERKVLLKNLEFLKCFANTVHWFHLPLKNGIKLKSATQTAELLYWNPFVAGDFDGTYKIPPISKKLLAWAVELTNENNMPPSPDGNPVYETWDKLSALISSWGCCSDAMRA